MADVIGELVARLAYELDDGDLKKFRKGTDDAETSAKSFAKTLANGATVAATFAAGIAAAAIKIGTDLVTGFAESGAEIDKWARKVGAGTTELQRFEFAGRRVGAETDNVREAVKTLRENLGEMERVGSGPAVDSLGTLGIKLEEIKDLSIEDQFGLIATAMNELPDQAQRVSVALELMGEDGGALLPLFEQGASGIKKLGDEAERTGQVLDKEAISKAKETAASLKRMEDAQRRVSNVIAEKLAPLVEKAANGIEQWISENEDFIEQDLPDILETIATTTGEVVAFFVEAITTVDDFASEITQLAERIEQDYGPAIEMAVEIGETLLDIFTFIPRKVGEAVTELLDFLGVLDDIEETVDSLLGKRDLDLKGRLDAAARGEEYNGRRAPENEQQRAARLERERQRAAEKARADKEAQAAQSAEEAEAAKDAAVRAGRRRKFQREAKGKGRGGGGMSAEDRKAIAAASAEFGDLFTNEASRQGATDQALQAGLLAAGKSLGEGASNRIAREAGLSKIKSLTGDPMSDRPIEDLLLDAVGLTPGRPSTTGGPSPVTGASFVRVDASYNDNSTMTITVEGSGLSAEELEEKVWSKIEDRMDDARRRQYDRHKAQVMT